MVEFRYKLPTLTSSAYHTLIKALRYYQLSCVEFSFDGDFITELYEIIDYIDESSDLIKYEEMR